MKLIDAILLVLIVCAIVSAVSGLSEAATKVADHDSCVKHYMVCVETTDGWKPYQER